MYIDLNKFLRKTGYVSGILIILLGALFVIISQTAEEQSAGTLTAIFGLLLTWFMVWLGRD